MPAAPYYMAQAILVQEQALPAASQQRIEELEPPVTERPAGGGLLGSLFGAGPQRHRRRGRPRAFRPSAGPAMGRGPWGGGGGGGFMAGRCKRRWAWPAA